MPAWSRPEGVVADFRTDQAAGLRRLLGSGQQLQVVTFVAGCEGVGRSVAVANIGVALARLGKEVLIIDEHAPGDDIASAFGLTARSDLLNVVQRELPLSQVLLQPMHGLRVLPAARAVKKLGRLSLPQQQTLLDAMSGLERPIDVILVDASMAHPNGFSRRHFRILVSKVRSQPDARSIYENIAQVATQRGIARLDYAGAIPRDDALRQSAQLGRPVLVQAPDSQASAAFRDIASDMLYWQRSESEAAGVEQFMQQLIHLSQRITPNVLRA